MNRELLEEAYAIIDGIPEERINLDTWQRFGPDGIAKQPDQIHCGTLACAAGWLALHPAMREKGLGVWGITGAPTFGGNWSYSALSEFFGISYLEALRLFGIRGECTYDPSIDPEAQLSGKHLFLARVRRFLKENEA